MSALTAFESAGRHLSFSRAAAELHLTQGAISRQVRQLEETLGVVLFERVNQRVFLTDAGRLYLREVQRILADLGAATQRVLGFAGTAGTLNLAVLPTFATRWLMPRLPGFLRHHPDTTVNFSVRLEPFDFLEEPFDGAIHHGEPTWPGAVCEHLCDESVLPVAAPGLREKLGIGSPEDLDRVPLLHQSTRPTAWRDWFAAAGVTSRNAFKGAHFDQFAMIAEAAVAGLGVALVPRFLVEEELRSGRLVVLFDAPLSSGTGYWFVYPEAKSGSALVRAFADWLKREAG
ncbi:LysR family transcriptional regulator [Chthonobacter albigriseus]|uniref:LysR family transcriptional regulator n=1 Tax=Chthonobacter albigriseus TaxID=1683161 RepID=UPI001FCEB3AB|nr:LysR family transcriptional regulator [Chthonobacter albigriseus]